MAKLLFYSTNGHQLDPETNSPSTAPGIFEKVIDYNLQLYVDSENLRVAALVRAETTASTREVDTYYALYHGENREKLLVNFANALDQVSSGDVSSDHEWNFIQDGREEQYELPWIAREESEKNLTDIGLDHAEQLSVEQLLSKGNQLTVGITSWRSTAIAINHVLKQPEIEISIGTHRYDISGKPAFLRDTSLIIKPGEAANFLPLDTSTSEKFSNRKESLVEAIEDQCKSVFKNQLTAVVESPINIREHDLLAIRSYLNNEPHDEPRGQAGQELVAVIDKVTTGGIVNGKYDTKVLDDAERNVLTETFKDWIENKIDQISSDIDSQYQHRFEELIDSTVTYPRQQRYEVLEEVKNVIDDGSRPQTPDSITEQVKSVLEDLQSSELIKNNQRRAIKNQVRDYIKGQQNECVEQERDYIESQFENARETIRENSIEDQIILAKVAETEIRENVEQHDTDGERSGRPREYIQAVEELEQSPIIGKALKSTIRNEELVNIRDLKHEIDRRFVERKENELRRPIENGQSGFDSIKEEVSFLFQAKQIVSNTAGFGFTDEPEIDSYFLDQLQKTVTQLEAVDRPIYVSTREVRNNVAQYIDDEIRRLEEAKFESIKTKILDDIDTKHYNHDPSEVIEELSHLENQIRQLRNKSLNTTSSDGSPYEIQQDILEYKQLFENQSRTIEPTVKNTLDQILDGIEEQKNNQREILFNNIKEQFCEKIDDITSTFRLTSYEKLCVLDRIAKELHMSVDIIPKDSIGPNFGSNLSTNSFKESISELKECLVEIHISDSHLDDNRRRELKSHFENILRQEIDIVRQDIKEELTDDIIDKFRQEYLPNKRYIDCRVSELLSAIDNLESATPYHVNDQINLDLNDERQTYYNSLSDSLQNDIHNEVSDWISEEKQKIRSNAETISYKTHLEVLQSVTRLEDPLDTIIALKQLQQVTNGSRNSWPDAIDSKPDQPPKEYDLGSKLSEFENDLRNNLKEEGKSYRDELTAELDNTLAENENEKWYSHGFLENLKESVQDGSITDRNVPDPLMETLKMPVSKLQNVDPQDKTVQRIQQALIEVLNKHLKGLNGKTSILPEISPVSRSVPTPLSTRSGFLTVSIIFLIIIAVVVTMMFVSIGGDPLSIPGSDGTDLRFGSVSFAENESLNESGMYELEYTVGGGNINSENSTHSVTVTDSEIVQSSTIVTRTSEGDDLTVQDRSDSSNRSQIEFQVPPVENDTSNEITVTSKLQITPDDTGNESSHQITVSVTDSSGESVNEQQNVSIVENSSPRSTAGSGQ